MRFASLLDRCCLINFNFSGGGGFKRFIQLAKTLAMRVPKNVLSSSGLPALDAAHVGGVVKLALAVCADLSALS